MCKRRGCSSSFSGLVRILVSAVFLAIKVSFRVARNEINVSHFSDCVRMVALRVSLGQKSLRYARTTPTLVSLGV